MRPSTLLRIERLTALVAAFSARDLSLDDVAALLRCSASSARNYAFELADAGIILCAPPQPADRCADRHLFAITRQTALVDAFMAGLANPGGFAVARASGGNPFPVVVQRDPLVAALFGAARAPAESRA